MSDKEKSVWSVVKFKIKEEHIKEFLKIHIPKFPNNSFRSGRLLYVRDAVFVNIIEYENMFALLDQQDASWKWFNSIEHLLEWKGEKRTEAFSGTEVYKY